MKPEAVVLLSGGLDSAVMLYAAMAEGYKCRSLIFDYGQRHRKEIECARLVAGSAGSKYEVVKLNFPWKGSSLVDEGLRLPLKRALKEIGVGIPTTYVPARNKIFLSIGVSFAEATLAQALFIGAHAEDSSGYPDCRREYLEAFDKCIRLGTKAGIEGRLSLRYPLVDMDKRGIIKLGLSLGVPFHITWSCYKGESIPCMECDSCILRNKGFEEAGIADPALEGHRIWKRKQLT